MSRNTIGIDRQQSLPHGAIENHYHPGYSGFSNSIFQAGRQPAIWSVFDLIQILIAEHEVTVIHHRHGICESPRLVELFNRTRQLFGEPEVVLVTKRIIIGIWTCSQCSEETSCKTKIHTIDHDDIIAVCIFVAKRHRFKVRRPIIPHDENGLARLPKNTVYLLTKILSSRVIHRHRDGYTMHLLRGHAISNSISLPKTIVLLEYT